MLGTERGQDLAEVTHTTGDATETRVLLCDARAGFLKPHCRASGERYQLDIFGATPWTTPMSAAIHLVVFIFVAMEALGDLWVTGEEAGPGDHFLCAVRICGYEITTEPLLGSRAEGCRPSCGEWVGLVILPFFWLVSGAPINSLKYHRLQEALPVLPEWGCCPHCTVLSCSPP